MAAILSRPQWLVRGDYISMRLQSSFISHTVLYQIKWYICDVVPNLQCSHWSEMSELFVDYLRHMPTEISVNIGSGYGLVPAIT